MEDEVGRLAIDDETPGAGGDNPPVEASASDGIIVVRPVSDPPALLFNMDSVAPSLLMDAASSSGAMVASSAGVTPDSEELVVARRGGESELYKRSYVQLDRSVARKEERFGKKDGKDYIRWRLKCYFHPKCNRDRVSHLEQCATFGPCEPLGYLGAWQRLGKGITAEAHRDKGTEPSLIQIEQFMKETGMIP